MGFLVKLATSAITQKFILFLLQQAAMATDNKVDDAVVGIVKAAYANDEDAMLDSMSKLVGK